MISRGGITKDVWRGMLIALATESEPIAPGRAYFIATGDGRTYASHRGRPGLQAMERRGWVKHFDRPFWAQIRTAEDARYAITDEGRKQLETEGFGPRACQVTREEWGR